MRSQLLALPSYRPSSLTPTPPCHQVLYPNFLSPAEVDHLLDLSRWGQAEAAAAASFTVSAKQAVSWDGVRPAKVAASGRTVSIHLPTPSDDPIIQVSRMEEWAGG